MEPRIIRPGVLAWSGGAVPVPSVILRKHGLIESLLRKGVNLDKAGSYCEISTVLTCTSLLKAYGANPQIGFQVQGSWKRKGDLLSGRGQTP
ncbi:hypothetical protein DPMN_093971 [Dreissena polymorpha]|uniref:Uncharacterized protein n=1 Tax=Dreissena polymorpha TaxID=45954 RepID=A0A9D4R1I1_DREPO|nr:hypothetical protein DPMN_093971 [Dreissena polymorpha]